MESLGFRPGKAYAWLFGGAELLGGLALAVGLLTPMAATLVTAVTVGAILAVHREKGFFAQAGGYEYPLSLAFASMATVFAGAGRYSLDHVLGWSLAGEEWGVAAVVAALGLGMAALVSRSLRVRPWRQQHPAQHLISQGPWARGDELPLAPDFFEEAA